MTASSHEDKNIGTRNWWNWSEIAEDFHKHSGYVKVWDWRTAKLVSEYETPMEPVFVAYSPVGDYIVAVCGDGGGKAGELLILDAEALKLIARRPLIRKPAPRVCLLWYPGIVFSPGGDRFVTYSRGTDAFVWNTSSFELEHELDHDNVTTDVDFSPDGRFLATASRDRTAKVWDVSGGQLASEPLPHPDHVFRVQFSDDGQQLLTSCRDHMARLWNWRNRQLVAPAYEHDDEVFDAQFTPDGQGVLTASRDGKITLWDRRTSQALAPTWSVGGVARQLRFVKDEPYVLIAGQFPRLDIFKYSSPDNYDSLDAAGLLLVGELYSGRRPIRVAAMEGQQAVGGTAFLTSAEWYDRWTRLRQAYPQFDLLKLPRNDIALWHQLKARSLFQQNRLAAAAWHLNRLLRLRIDDPQTLAEAYYLQARCNVAATDFERAVADCDQALQHDMKTPTLYRLRALCHEGLGQDDAVRDDLREAARLYPLNAAQISRDAYEAGMFYQLARELYQNDHLIGAQAALTIVKRQLERSIISDTRNALHYYNMACANSFLAELKSKLDEADRQILELKQASVAAFRQALDAGYTDLEQAKQDVDLAFVRDMPAYRTMLGRNQDQEQPSILGKLWLTGKNALVRAMELAAEQPAPSASQQTEQ